MYVLLHQLEWLQLSMATLSIGTGLMLGTFVGQFIPVAIDESNFQQR